MVSSFVVTFLLKSNSALKIFWMGKLHSQKFKQKIELCAIESAEQGQFCALSF